jgi:hypothetical protein
VARDDDIEFLGVDPGPRDGDEDLPDPGRHASPGATTLRRVVGVGLAVVVIGGLLVARSVGGGGHHTAAVVPSSAPVSSVAPSFHGSFVALDPTSGLHLTLDPIGPSVAVGAAGTCPEADDGESACTSVGDVPADVLAAIHDRFPKAVVTASRTDYIRENHNLWHRRIQLASGGLTLSIIVQQNAVPIAPTPNVKAPDISEQAINTGATLTTVIDVVGAQNRLPDQQTLFRMAGDGRLTRLT